MNNEQLLLELYKQQQFTQTRVKLQKTFMFLTSIASITAVITASVFYVHWLFIAAYGGMFCSIAFNMFLTQRKIITLTTASYLSMLYACFVMIPILWLLTHLTGSAQFVSLIILVSIVTLYSGKELKWLMAAYLLLLAGLTVYSAIYQFVNNEEIAHLVYFIASYSVAVALVLSYFASTQKEYNALNNKFLRNSFKDELTHVYNRKLLDLIIEHQESLYKKDHTNYTLVMFDVDDFKKMNDEHGHVFGDIVLRSIADCIHDTTREDDFVVRYGGDEFLVIQTNASNASVQMFTNRIGDKMKTACQLEIPVAVSFGYAIRSECDAPEAVLKLADERLYEQKASKKASY